MEYKNAVEKLKKYGQMHVLKYYDDLDEAQRNQLLMQINDIDFSMLSLCGQDVSVTPKGVVTPIEALQLKDIEINQTEYVKLGIEIIRQQKTAAVLLAGGMGTRLGSDDPKGMYNIGITKEVYIFQRLFENLMDVVKLTGSWIYLFIMTSEKNHDITIDFLKKHQFFGYNEAYIYFFKQQMAPAADYFGKVFMEEKYKIAVSPNGNGGWFSSMLKTEIMDIIQTQKIEWLNVFAVDNVLQRICDPCFIGAVVSGGFKSGAKVVKKVSPDEKIGVMCLEDGHPSIVEYYELNDALKNTRDANGHPAYNFGVILNYLFKTEDLLNIVQKRLPLHRVEKKINHIDESGSYVKPEKPNGYKFETLILDMIHLFDNCLPFEVDRNKEFAPIKNKTGIDSVESARRLCQKNNIDL